MTLTIVLPYVEEHEKFKAVVESIRKFVLPNPCFKLKLCHDKDKRGFDYWISKEMKEGDNVIPWHADLFATKEWAGDLLDYFGCYDLIGSKLVYPDGKLQFYGGFYTTNQMPYHANQHEFDNFNERRECEWLTLAGCVYKRKVIEKIGVLDPIYKPAYFSDPDYCVRAKAAGFTVGVVPATLVHEESFDNKKDPRELQAVYQKNAMIFLNKWGDLLRTNYKKGDEIGSRQDNDNSQQGGNKATADRREKEADSATPGIQE